MMAAVMSAWMSSAMSVWAWGGGKGVVQCPACSGPVHSGRLVALCSKLNAACKVTEVCNRYKQQTG
jgi:hypothetical protein